MAKGNSGLLQEGGHCFLIEKKQKKNTLFLPVREDLLQAEAAEGELWSDKTAGWHTERYR